MKPYAKQYGSGPDLVLVHGWGMNGHVWSEVINALKKHFRITVVDLPGHGRSSAAPNPYTLKALAQSIVEIISPAIWMGWSFGGLISLTAAQYWPEKVTNLILVGATPKFMQSSDWQAGVSLELLTGFGDDLLNNYQKTINRFLSLQFADAANSKVLLKQLRQQIFQYPAPDPQVLLDGLRLLQQSDLRASLSEIHQPTLIVHGDRDRLVPPSAAHYLNDHLPHAQLITLAKAGHAPFVSESSEFVQSLYPFIEMSVNTI